MTTEARRLVIVEAAVCAALATMVFLAFDIWRPFNLGDEAFRYLLARSWARGENLFERFMVLYPTGQYVFFGSVMRVLGEGLWVLRLGRAVLGGTAVFLLFITLRRRDASPLPWALALAVATSCVAGEKIFASTLVLCAVFVLADTAGPDKRWLFISAAAAGFLAGWREDGAVLMAAVAVLWVFRRRRPMELITVAVPAAAAGFAFWVVIEWVRGDATSFVHHAAHRLAFVAERFADRTNVVWDFPPKRLPRSPFEFASQIMPVLAAVPVLVYGGLLAQQFLRWRRTGGVQHVVVASALAGFAYLPQFLWERPDIWHFIDHLSILLTVVAFAAAALTPSGRRRVAAVLLVLGVVSGGAKILKARTVDVVTYPTESGHKIGIGLNGHPPEWAGIPKAPGETLIVLGWGAGWYVAEGIDPGTRFLSTFSRHLPTEAEQKELDRDLENPRNRWVIKAHGAAAPDIYLPVIRGSYTLVGRWRNWELWERFDAGKRGFKPPILSDGFEAANTWKWSAAN